MVTVNRQTRLFYLISVVLLGISAGFILLHIPWLILFIPVVLLLFYFAFFQFDILFLVTVALIPLSVPLRELQPGLGVDLSLPAEPLMAVILLLMIMKGIQKSLFPARFFRHPLTIAILGHLAWLFITSITSTIPLVSFKYFFSQLWFITTAYFLGYLFFRDRKFIFRFLLVYLFPLILVILFTFYHQAQTGFFNQKLAHSAMHPFYNDHTAFGAILAMYIPLLAGLALLTDKFSRGMRIFFFVLSLLFITALVFSYSRAAWISVAGMFFVFLLIRFRIKLHIILAGTLIILVSFITFYRTLWLKMEENRQESSGSLAKHVESITNIRSDASNLERILRWKSAISMFSDKPVLGWGPGTYMFKYAPFQHSYDRTIISTDFGDHGNAHSEYLGPLAETGLPGLAIILCIVFYALFTGIKNYHHSPDNTDRILSVAVVLGLVTYFIHGTLNNFLDTDKLAIPFWGFLAILVALEHHKKAGTH